MGFKIVSDRTAIVCTLVGVGGGAGMSRTTPLFFRFNERASSLAPTRTVRLLRICICSTCRRPLNVSSRFSAAAALFLFVSPPVAKT